MKRDLLLTAIMLVCVWCLPLSLCAQEEVQCLAVECADGETDYFALDASPVITYGEGTLNITQSGDDAYSIADLALDYVSKCYFTSAVPTSADEGGVPAGYILDPADGAYVATLSVIELSYENNSLCLGSSAYNDGIVASVIDHWGQTVATGHYEESLDEETYITHIICTIDPAITSPGMYTVEFPAGSFIDYDTFDSNKAFSVTYYVTGATDGEYSFDPASGSTLSSLESFDVCHSVSINCAWNGDLIIYVTDESGNIVAYDDDCEDNWPDSYDDPCLSCTITLNTKIVAAGTYTISIPEGYFVVGENDLLSEALTAIYTIDGSEDTGSEGGDEGGEGGDEGGEETGLQSLSAGDALMTGLAAGANVYVYTADGQTVLAATAGNDGTVRVDLSSLKGGQVYILRTPGATYKIVK